MEKNKEGNIAKYELEVNDNQSANKYVIVRSSHQIYALLQRVQDENLDVEEVKKLLIGGAGV